MTVAMTVAILGGVGVSQMENAALVVVNATVYDRAGAMLTATATTITTTATTL